jgi:hypothetical protein
MSTYMQITFAAFTHLAQDQFLCITKKNNEEESLNFTK